MMIIGSTSFSFAQNILHGFQNTVFIVTLSSTNDTKTDLHGFEYSKLHVSVAVGWCISIDALINVRL